MGNPNLRNRLTCKIIYRRTVSVEWSLRRANCKRFTHKRPTDGSVSRTVGCSLERRTQWRCMSDAHVQRSSVSKPFSQTSSFLCLWGGPEQNTLNTKHLNCQPLRSFPVKPVANRLHHQQTHANVKRTGSFPDKAEEYAPDVSLQGVIPRRYAFPLAFHGAVQILSQFSPTHGLERRLVRFLRLHRATLCRF